MSSPAAPAGFTLIELIVAVALAGLMLSLVSLNWTRRESEPLSTPREEVAEALRVAARSGHPRTLTLETADGAYVLVTALPDGRVLGFDVPSPWPEPPEPGRYGIR